MDATYELCSVVTANKGDAPIAVVQRASTASTSADAKEWVRSIAACGRPRAFSAVTQTGGVGRLGRAWSSPMGGLWMTLASPLAPEAWAPHVEGLGLRVGVACAEAVRRVAPDEASAQRICLKWPNDVLLDGLKVCGALVEVVIGSNGNRWALVGVGVNAEFDREALPEAVRPRATTLRSAFGAPVNLDALRDDLIRSLARAASERGAPPTTLNLARAMLAGVGERAVFTTPDGGRLEGTLRGLDEQGRAIVESDEGVPTALASGEQVE